MDGNGRWARSKGLPRVFGHREGAKRVREIVRACGEIGVKKLTLFAFSEENWKRPPTEVSVLMRLLEFHLVSERERLNSSGVRLKVIGRLDKLPERVQKTVRETCEYLSSNKGLELTLAISYSGQSEWVDLCKSMAGLVLKGELRPEEITAETLSTHLARESVGAVDLLVRTSGEFRISNFLLWQIAYAELYFTNVCWPDFNRAELEKAVSSFGSRERRFGEVLDGGDQDIELEFEVHEREEEVEVSTNFEPSLQPHVTTYSTGMC